MAQRGPGRFVDHRTVDIPDGSQLLRGWTEYAARARERAVAALAACCAIGVTSIIDTSPIGLARAEAVAVSTSVAGIEAIFVTGVDDERCTPAALTCKSATNLADVFVTELADGISGISGAAGPIRPRLLLHGAGALGDFAATVVRAVSFAHAETGVPVVARSATDDSVEVVHQLMGRGVDPERIIAVGLDGVPPRFDVVDGIARTGAWLGFTSTGTNAPSVATRAAVIAYAIRTVAPGRVVIDADGSAAEELFTTLRQMGVSDDELAVVLANRPEVFP